MTPSSLGMGRMQLSGMVSLDMGSDASGGYNSQLVEQPAAPDSRVEALARRAETLWQRLVEIEDALAVREWWMLGRVLPEARLLAEIGSLLAVARGEMENGLGQGFGIPMLRSDTTDQYNAVAREETMHTDDPVWVASCRDQAVSLLRMMANSLAPMLQYAQMLRAYSEQLQVTVAAVDSFGIVADRLNEISDALRQPPQ